MTRKTTLRKVSEKKNFEEERNDHKEEEMHESI
jgi:hypothetical protein